MTRSEERNRAASQNQMSILDGTRAAAGMAAVAGFVNAVAYLGLHAFVAPMTGTIVQAGFELASAEWVGAVLSLLAIVAFTAGVAIARIMRRDGRGPGLCWLLSAAVLAIAGLRPLEGLASLAPIAGALGCLNGSQTRFGPVTLNTTFLTGNLERLGEAIGDHNMQHRPAQLACIAAIIVSYLSGATAGAAAARGISAPLLIPAALLAVMGVAAQFRRQVGSAPI